MLNFSHGARMCACPRSYKRPPGTTGARRLFGVGVFVGNFTQRRRDVPVVCAGAVRHGH